MLTAVVVAGLMLGSCSGEANESPSTRDPGLMIYGGQNWCRFSGRWDDAYGWWLRSSPDIPASARPDALEQWAGALREEIRLECPAERAAFDIMIGSHR